MPSRRLAPRRDNNHAKIVRELECLGASVTDLSAVGHGVPDILVGWNGANFLFEIKTKKGQLNPTQRKWFEQWNGQAHVIRSFEDAISIIMEHVVSEAARVTPGPHREPQTG